MKTKITLHFYAKSTKSNSAGQFPIYVRLTVDGKRLEFTRYSKSPDFETIATIKIYNQRSKKKTGTVFRKNTYASQLVPDLPTATANSHKKQVSTP